MAIRANAFAQHLQVCPAIVTAASGMAASGRVVHVLAFSATKTANAPLNIAYAAAYPLAMILKIVLAQILLALA